MRRKRRLKRICICVAICLLVVGIGPFIAFRLGIVDVAWPGEMIGAKILAYLVGPGNGADPDKPGQDDRVVYADGFYYEPLSGKIKRRITGKSFPETFPAGYAEISYEDLAYVRVKYYDFSGNVHDDGELIVHRDVAQDVVEIFHALYAAQYPFTSIRLVDDFDGSDEQSMAANNTSAFNYRFLENADELSWHCFGVAVDINPLYNPYILDSAVYPQNAEEYVDRSKAFAGKIDKEDLAYRLFTERGWLWGGDFVGTPDYQHFYKEDVVAYSLRYE